MVFHIRLDQNSYGLLPTWNATCSNLKFITIIEFSRIDISYVGVIFSRTSPPSCSFTSGVILIGFVALPSPIITGGEF